MGTLVDHFGCDIFGKFEVGAQRISYKRTKHASQTVIYFTKFKQLLKKLLVVFRIYLFDLFFFERTLPLRKLLHINTIKIYKV